MSLSDKPIESLSEADLIALVTNRVSETKTIEYKRDNIGNSDGDKKEYLYDISSFANAMGGHIVIGIEEKGGVPANLLGVELDDPDAEKLRLEEMARDGIRPRIPGFQVHGIPLNTGRTALVLRIPRSWTAPHQVVYQKAFRIYGRGNAGKHLLDVDELRAVFSFSASAAEQMRQFRLSRIAKIISDDTIVGLEGGGKVVTHVLPLSAFSGLPLVDLSPLVDNPLPLARFLTNGGGQPTFTVDGLWTAPAPRPASRFAQAFRDGCLEAISGFSENANIGRFVPALLMEQELALRVSAARQIFAALNISPPFAVMVTFVGTKGWRLRESEHGWGHRSGFDRDPVFVPDIVLTTLSGDLWPQMKPLLDMVWNAAGASGSPFYGSDGIRGREAL